MSNYIDIVFQFDSGPPASTTGRFLRVERDGRSVAVGEWVRRGDGPGLWALRLPNPDTARAEGRREGAQAAVQRAKQTLAALEQAAEAVERGE